MGRRVNACVSVGVLGETWSSSSVLMVGEVIKLVFSVVMTLADTGATSADGTGLAKLWWLVWASAPMSIPAVVFWLMNLLSYVSLKRVDASTFTVCAQVCLGSVGGAGEKGRRELRREEQKIGMV